MLILKSTDLTKFQVLTNYTQCLDVAVVVCLTILLKLDYIDNNTIKRAAGLVCQACVIRRSLMRHGLHDIYCSAQYN
jgi:hypothetical protein